MPTTPVPTNDHLREMSIAQPVHDFFVENTAEVAYASGLPVLTTYKPTFTRPTTNLATGRVVVDRIDGNELASYFFGTGADNATAGARLTRWDRLRHKTPSAAFAANNVEPLMYIPRVIVTLDLLLSGTVGADHSAGIAGLIASTHRLVDTISIASNRSLAAAGVRIGQGAAGDEAMALVAVENEGAPLYTWDLTCGTATGINVATRSQSRAF